MSAYADRATIKCYMADTGLLVTQALADSNVTEDDIYRDVLLGKISINEGMLTENVVAQLLHSSGHALYFYSRNDRDDASLTARRWIRARGG